VVAQTPRRSEAQPRRGVAEHQIARPPPPKLDYWRKPPDLGLTEKYWNDPRPDLQGMLNSETIVFYEKAIGE